MAGAKDWNVHVSVACSGGPLASSRESSIARSSLEIYPKALAQLENTTADLDLLGEWSATDWPRDAHHKLLVRCLEPDYRTVSQAFTAVTEWLEGQAENHDYYDGAELVFSFSGHGRRDDGALCLRDDTFFDAQDLLSHIYSLSSHVRSPRGYKLALLLDSCYSASFMLSVLDQSIGEGDWTPEYMLASSMVDEVSFEVATLGHGLSTFCFSAKRAHPMALVSEAGEQGIRIWSLATGPLGASYATAGAQNPVVYDGGYLRTAGGEVAVWTGSAYTSERRSLGEWRSDLNELRDETKLALARLPTTVSIGSTDMSDEYVKGELRERFHDPGESQIAPATAVTATIADDLHGCWQCWYEDHTVLQL